MELLKASGILPTSGQIDEYGLTQFHQWFLGMDSEGTYSDLMTLFEGQLLIAWAQSMDSSPFNSVIVFDAINAFQQYTSYCQLVMGDEVITLSHFVETPVDYDATLHSSFGIIHHHQWTEPSDGDSIDYTNAHTGLALSAEDEAAINAWLLELFPEGIDQLSDDDVLLAVFNAINGDEFSYQSDIGDHWESMAQFLLTKTGDCEEFSHLLFHSLTMLYSQYPDRTAPQLELSSGLVGSGISVFGHSIVLLERNGQIVVFDSRNASITSLDDLPLLDDFIQQVEYEEFIRYNLVETTLNVDASQLDHFSTSTNYDDLNAQFQAIFGNDVDFESVVSDTDSDFDIDTYDALIQKVIALEMQRLIESGNADGISILLQTDLFDLPYDFSQHITSTTLTSEQQAYLNDFLAANVGLPNVTNG